MPAALLSEYLRSISHSPEAGPLIFVMDQLGNMRPIITEDQLRGDPGVFHESDFVPESLKEIDNKTLLTIGNALVDDLSEHVSHPWSQHERLQWIKEAFRRLEAVKPNASEKARVTSKSSRIKSLLTAKQPFYSPTAHIMKSKKTQLPSRTHRN